MPHVTSRDGFRADRHAPEAHRSVQGGAARAAVFGISDGLVTNLSLVIGMSGAHPAPRVVQLAGLAGLVAGACSMAVGEYVSMRAQRELLERELDVERREIQRYPDAEHRELSTLYEQRGLPPALAQQVATIMMRDEDTAVESHAQEELGIDLDELGSPTMAAASSFVSFGVGALVPLLPWLVIRGTAALLMTVTFTAAMSALVGGVLSRFTGRPWLRSALRQVGLSAVAGGICFVLGTVAGRSGLR